MLPIQKIQCMLAMGGVFALIQIFTITPYIKIHLQIKGATENCLDIFKDSESIHSVGAKRFQSISNEENNVTVSHEGQRPSAVLLVNLTYTNVRRIKLSNKILKEEDSDDEEGELIDWKAASIEVDSSNPCQPMYEWQTQSFPVCNNIHELDLGDARDSLESGSRYVTAGGHRDLWEAKTTLNASVAMKTLRMHKDFDKSKYHQQNTDALIAERLTSSKYFADIYGYCKSCVPCKDCRRYHWCQSGEVQPYFVSLNFFHLLADRWLHGTLRF